LQFQWYGPVYYKVDDSDFPSDSREKRGQWVGIAEHVGHAMTFKVLTDDTNKIVCRSNIRSAIVSVPAKKVLPTKKRAIKKLLAEFYEIQEHGEEGFIRSCDKCNISYQKDYTL
jgi:hypothetical protein